MAEYIEREAFFKKLKENHDNIMSDPNINKRMKWYEALCYNRIIKVLYKTPLVGVVEVVHGEWEQVRQLNVAVNPYQHTCGICGKSYFDHNKSNYPYCPNCGAKMNRNGD